MLTPPAPRRGAVKALDLADLDEGGLQDAVASSASATAQSFADLGKSLLAFGGAFANSQDQREAALLLGAASNETSALTSKLSTVGDDLAQDDAPGANDDPQLEEAFLFLAVLADNFAMADSEDVKPDVLVLDELDLEFEVMRMHGRRIADLHLRRSAPFAVSLPAALPEETFS